MKIAVIGAGIAGNTVVWRLKDHHDVTVFEAGSHLGGHTHTHRLELEGETVDVDSGFIVFNDRTYPHFMELLAALGVEKQATEMSFSVHCERSGFEYAGTSLNALFAQRRNLLSPRFYRLISDILRFNREAPAVLDGAVDGLTLGEYLRDRNYSEMFRHYYILPMGAAIWSQSVAALLEFPADFFIRFFANHGLLTVTNRPQWYVVKGGSRTYVDAIYRDFTGPVHLDTPVDSLRRLADGVELCSRRGTERFDAVFLACHADQALRLLRDPTAEEWSTLSAFPYQRNRALLHLGDDLLPRRALARSSWNYRLPPGDVPAATVTYDMKRLQSLPLRRDICVTLNGGEGLAPDKILATMDYQHPVFTRDGIAAQRRHQLVNGCRRTFYCGAYWRYGFHEDGVVSALAALDHFQQWAQDHDRKPLHRTG